jgi:hypothetical protein
MILNAGNGKFIAGWSAMLKGRLVCLAFLAAGSGMEADSDLQGVLVFVAGSGSRSQWNDMSIRTLLFIKM